MRLIPELRFKAVDVGEGATIRCLNCGAWHDAYPVIEHRGERRKIATTRCGLCFADALNAGKLWAHQRFETGVLA